MPNTTPISSHGSSRRIYKVSQGSKSSKSSLSSRNHKVNKTLLAEPRLVSTSKRAKSKDSKVILPHYIPPWASREFNAGAIYQKYITSGPSPSRHTFRRRISIIEANRIVWETQRIVETREARDKLRAEGIPPAGTVRRTRAFMLHGEVIVWGAQIGDFGSCAFFATREEAEAAAEAIRIQYKCNTDNLSAEELARMPVLGGEDDVMLEDCLVPKDFGGFWYNAQF